MKMTNAESHDSAAIIQLINLYGFAVDTQRWDLFDRIFASDVDADYSAAAHWRELKSFKADFAAFHAPFDSTQHCMMNHLVHVDGDTAQAFTYGTWRLIRRAAEGLPLWDGSGWYEDELVRSAAGWRIKQRICRVVWWTGNPLVNETIPGVKFELDSIALRREAQAGRVKFLSAIAANRS
jgi:SnoaL-like domain